MTLKMTQKAQVLTKNLRVGTKNQPKQVVSEPTTHTNKLVSRETKTKTTQQVCFGKHNHIITGNIHSIKSPEQQIHNESHSYSIVSRETVKKRFVLARFLSK